jgi:hypothetical protein
MNKDKYGKAIVLPEAPEDDQTQLIERADGFYWHNLQTGELVGPYLTLLEAMEDVQSQEEDAYDESALLHEVGDEIGIADWVDADTGELAEGAHPHLHNE